MRKIEFRDNGDFYDALKNALESGEDVEIATEFRSYDQVPQKLKDVFELEKSRSSTWIDLITGDFVALSHAASALNMNALYVLGAAGVGAAVGVWVGGPVGAGVGALVGAAAGAVAAAVSQDDFEVEIEITADGRLVIRVKKNQEQGRE